MDRNDLHDYQRYSVEFIKEHPVAALFLDCGMGKTVTTLTAIDDLMYDSFEIQKVLVICPLRVAAVWQDEVEHWEHLRHLRISLAIGTQKQRLRALCEPADIYVINRENVPWLVMNSHLPWDYDMVVVDELSSFKNYKAQRCRALLRVRPLVGRIVGLTGTPSSNGLMDLFSEFKVLDMGERLGRFISHYRDRYFVPDKRSQQMVFSYKPKPGAEDAIYRAIGDITISMQAADFLHLPERVDNIVKVRMSPGEKKKYDAMKKDMTVELGNKEIDAVSAGALSNKLLQMADGAVYDEEKNTIRIHDHKLDALEDLIESANGKPVLVAYWFQHDLQRIKERFDVREIKMVKDIRDWNEGRIPVACIHPASAGHGLNLQAGGSMLVWFGLTWSLELYQQCNARLYRQGQKRTVIIHHIVTEGTIDEDVLKALKHKDKTQAALISAVKAHLGGNAND